MKDWRSNILNQSIVVKLVRVGDSRIRQRIEIASHIYYEKAAIVVKCALIWLSRTKFSGIDSIFKLSGLDTFRPRTPKAIDFSKSINDKIQHTPTRITLITSPTRPLFEKNIYKSPRIQEEKIVKVTRPVPRRAFLLESRDILPLAESRLNTETESRATSRAESRLNIHEPRAISRIGFLLDSKLDTRFEVGKSLLNEYNVKNVVDEVKITVPNIDLEEKISSVKEEIITDKLLEFEARLYTIKQAKIQYKKDLELLKTTQRDLNLVILGKLNGNINELLDLENEIIKRIQDHESSKEKRKNTVQELLNEIESN